ncbi:MAG: Catalytic LigB subunit of aromatic ring-opening dioxygenase superfamily [Thermomicrobiales bacterium]|nr:Catalytic LigB subunit of aromatic ring-opening dioxygenase superfamily [Thermomicrobiales bacterium]
MPGHGNVLADPPADDIGPPAVIVTPLHAHAAVGPYGFHDDSARVDAEVVAAVQANGLMRLMDLDEGRAKDAAIDGLWQALMLFGAFEVTPMNVELLSYEAPTYYGMLVAVWAP